MNKINSFIVILFSMLIPTSWAEPVIESTLADQMGIEVTAYNNNLALIKDIRRITLEKGSGELRFKDVAAHIMPVTVHATSKNAADEFRIYEQNYEYDLLNQNKLLNKYVGQRIKLIDWNKYQDRKETVEATLLSNNGGPVYQINDEIYLGHPGIKVLPEVLGDFIAQPTLTWLYQNQRSKPHELEVSYLTNNVTWKADYVLVVNDKSDEGNLAGWVSLDNRSGATYTDAKLKLVAGDVQRVSGQRPGHQKWMRAETVMMADAGASFQQKEFFEYHIYDLQRMTTLKNNQIKQISFLEADQVDLIKEYVVQGAQHYYVQRYQRGLPKQPVHVYFSFKNEKRNQLGVPLPEGVLRLYQKDEDQSLQFIGEDRISHTPKNEDVRVRVGKAFDIVAERKQLDYDRKTKNMHESEWEITLRNHKGEAVTVDVVETLYSNWKMLSHSHPYAKEDAFKIKFSVNVPGDGEVKVRYRVSVGLS